MSNLPYNYDYRPLPDGLYISESDIDGQGLFTEMDIPLGTVFGKTHFRNGDELIRFPLGGFINHSVTPNCRITDFEYSDSKYLYLVTSAFISEGEELTVDYFKSDCAKDTVCKNG